MAMKKRQTTDLLHRLLGLIPVLFTNPGLTVQELGRLSGFENRGELRTLLSRMLMFGTPPFSPADFIDIYIDDDDRIYLEFPQGLERPRALTPDEWSAVRRTIEEELEFQRSGEEGASDLGEILSRLSSVPVLYEDSDPFRNKRSIVEEALHENLQIEFGYQRPGSPAGEVRRVDPWALFRHRGNFYLIAFCHLRLAPRYFHLERMRDIEILELLPETEAPADLRDLLENSVIFRTPPSGLQAQLAFSGEVRAPLELHLRIYDIQPAGADFPPGWQRAACRITDGLWFRSRLRSFGTSVILLEPAHLRETFREELEGIPLPDGFEP